MAAAPTRRSDDVVAAMAAAQDAANEKAEEHANRTYIIGDRVEARWDGRPEWFPGRVIAMNDDETYDILYDDGEDELHVKPALMKREPPRKRKTVDYGDMMDSGDGVPQRRSPTRLLSFWGRVDRVFHTDDDEKPFEQPLEDEDYDNDEDLAFGEDDKSANQPMDEEEDNDEDLPSRKKRTRREGATLCGNQPVS